MVEFKLEYINGKIILPINPQDLITTYESDHKSAEVVGIGEIQIPGQRKLATTTISSFFWQNRPNKTPDTFNYINFIKTAQLSMKPIRFTTTGINPGIDMDVLITSFEHETRAGEENDPYYTLELKEFRAYGAKLVEIKKVEKVQTTTANTPKTLTLDDLKVGQIIYFTGCYHYVSSTASSPTGGKRSAGNATITQLAKKNKHPVHLIGTKWPAQGSKSGGSNVWGWVDVGCIQGIVQASTNKTTPSTPARTSSTSSTSKSKTSTASTQSTASKYKGYNTYTTKSGDSLWSVARDFGPSGFAQWYPLYERNKSYLTTKITSGTEKLPAGTILIIPSAWGVKAGITVR